MHRVLTLVALAILLTALLSGQTFSSMNGTVSDPSGAVLPGAKITLTNTDNAGQRAALTDEQGRYSFSQMPPGTYRLSAEAPGFTALTTENIRLLVNTPVTLDLTFEKVGTVATAVMVAAEATQVNTSDATIGNAVGDKVITQLPLEGRNVVGLLAVQPGVVYLGEPDPSKLNDYRSGAVNGTKSDQANVTLDGVDANDSVNGAAFKSVLRVTLDSVQEFRTITTNAGAEMGRSSGAQVSLVTKSGTNTIHGSAYEFLRNTATTANNFFNNAAGIQRPTLNRNVFGGSVGGPVKKNRLFYFLNYEGRRDASQSTALRVVPNATYRQGTFTYVRRDNTIGSISGDQLRAQDPQGIGVDPAVLADFNKYPLPNDTSVGDGLNTGGYRFNASTPLSWNTYISKIDYQIDNAGKHQIFWRGNLQNDYFANGIPQFPGQSSSSVFLENSKGYALGYTAILTPSLVSTFRYGFTRQGVETTGVLNSVNARFSDIATLYPTTLGSATIAPVTTLSEDLVWTKGAHTISFGGVGRLTHNKFSGPGDYSYGVTYAGWYFNDGQDLLPADAKPSQTAENGVINLFGILSQLFTNQQYDKTGKPLPQGTIVKRDWVQHSVETYVQDSWKVKPNLTATVGLRYSLNPAVYEANGYQVSPLVPFADIFQQRGALAAAGQSQITAPLVQFDLYGKPGTRGLYEYQKNWSPRVAIAYSPKGTSGLSKFLFGGPGKTSIRAGWGMYYDNFGEALANRFSTVQLGLSTSLRNASGQPASALDRYQGFYNVPLDKFAPAPPGGFPQLVPLTGQNTRAVDDQIQSPYNMNANISIGREFKGGLFVQAAYISHQARRSLIGEDMMPPTNLVDNASGMTYYQAAQILGRQAIANVPVGNVAPVAFWQNLWPGAAGGGLSATQNIYKMFVTAHGDYTTTLRNLDVNCTPSCSILGKNALWQQQYVDLLAMRSLGFGNYNGLALTVRKRFSQGVQFDLNYTWSKSIDWASSLERDGGSTIGNPWIANQNKAVSDYDLTHVVSALGVFELPFGKGRLIAGNANPILNNLIGGWQLSSIFRVTSGFVTSVANGVGYPTTWNSIKYATQTGLAPVQETQKNAPSATKGGAPGPNMFADPAAAFAAYSPTLAGEIGQRNGIRGDGIFNVDLSLGKRFNLFKIKDQQHSLQFRAEAFNVSNTVRFDIKSASLDNNNQARFGKYTQILGSPRVFQFSARYEF